jgi:hypothetical protein
MSWKWEEFTQRSNYRAEIIRVSLNGRGHFLLNQKAVDELGGAEAVVLLYERSSRLIGLKPSPEDVEHAYELKRQGSSQTYTLRAKSFCTHYGIRVGDTIVFNDVQVENGMIVLNLDNVTEVVRRTRLTEFPAHFPERVRPIQPAKFSTLLRMRPPDEE